MGSANSPRVPGADDGYVSETLLAPWGQDRHAVRATKKKVSRGSKSHVLSVSLETRFALFRFMGVFSFSFFVMRGGLCKVKVVTLLFQ